MTLCKHLAIAAAATALLVGSAVPASAGPGDTATTFTLTSGSLALTVQPTAVLTGAAAGATVISGSLGATSVTDLRGVALAWTVSAASTAFSGPGGSASTAVSYTGGAVSKTGIITVADGQATSLTTTAAPVIFPSIVVGINTASWSAGLAVTMPVSSLAGAYSGTVTTSIL